MRNIRNITAAVKCSNGRLDVWRNNFCDYFEQDAGRLFSNRECWYCRHGDFGIDTELPTITGKCKYTENSEDKKEI
ncbi:MAG: hypothetical protein HGA22_08270 [Clostridiales bacterium]|nr:hypothetical protein [Clostridiales bacterium]